jgi:hyperosmotically inducible protein
MTHRSLHKSPAALALAALITIAPLSIASAGPQSTPQPTDSVLKDRIEYRVETDDTVRKYDINVKVDAGTATLSGTVATAAQKAEAARLAKIDGVAHVENKITVDPNADRTLAERTKAGLSKTGSAISDQWIHTKVSWFFVGEGLLKDSNINVDVKDRVVTLKGTVKSAAGRARAVARAKQTEGVKSVIDQLTIK